MRPEVKIEKRKRRHLRVRKKVIGTPDRPRLTVRKTLKHIYAQLVVDPPFGPARIITGVSSLSPEVREKLKEAKGKVEKARIVGKFLAERAKAKGIETVVFDRAGYKYHGRVRALADGAREGGLKF
jgi:large subunit ribosomal protein L18